MRHRWIVLACLFALAACGNGDNEARSGGDAPVAQGHAAIPGFIDLHWDEARGRLLIEIDAFDTPFLYQSSLPRGVGSNDLGLDRGRLGATRVVRFLQSGPKVLLLEDNLDYRAQSDNPAERNAVAESFATSVIWGFSVDQESDDGVLVDGTAFFLRDAAGVVSRLKRAGEGSYSVDASRSAIYLPRTKGFPDNTEIEAIVTFTGEPAGPHLSTVVPDATAVSVHMHHSFIRLPDDNYEPLPYDPRAGLNGLDDEAGGFADYSAPLAEPLRVDYVRRHRLEKRNPKAEVSEAVEPIVYYVDPGAPEPVRQALIEGASWWNQAFEAAGYKDAFQVKLLPEGADPMDVRYNMIQWVHRSARGWSYGRSVRDPRTGEIIKGHATLGSLRVRQDYLIIEGLLAPYAGADVPDTMLDVSLARIRQLSAHEVGHTLGLRHNFAGSTQDRASVMDYPFPLIEIGADGGLDFSKAYDEGIGAWDKRAILYAYQDFPDEVDAAAARAAIVEETIRLGYKFVTDADARSVATAHPDGNLWDNGSDAVAELEHLLTVRQYALERFSAANIRPGRPLAALEEVLVPVYLLHRFQLEAVGKLVGGSYFDYALRGDGRDNVTPVAEDRQLRAVAALVATLDPTVLRLPEKVAAMIPPRPPGHPKTRESFDGRTGIVFDPLAPAASAVEIVLDVLLNPERAARMQRNGAPGFATAVEALLDASWYAAPIAAADSGIRRQTENLVLQRLLRLGGDAAVDPDARAVALDAVLRLDDWLAGRSATGRAQRAHYAQARLEIDRWRRDPASVGPFVPVDVPPGSPIGAATE